MQAFLKSGESSFNTQALQHIANFDSIIGKACSICMLDELDIEQRQMAWFQVIRFLQKYKQMAQQKVQEAMDSVKKIIKFSAINKKNMHEFVKALQDFV